MPAIGLLINPIAGMGGAIGLNGTDGTDILTQACELGATPLAGLRALQAMQVLASARPQAKVVTAAGILGADALTDLDLSIVACGGPVCTPTNSDDTRRAAQSIAGNDVAAILFAGGDGTARDVVDVVGTRVPVLGIPCGVKMQSGVFAVTPDAAGRIAADLVDERPGHIAFREAEVMDLDEAALRTGHISPRLFGYACVPVARGLVQSAKGRAKLPDDVALTFACAEIAAALAPDTLTLIGPGTTAKKVLGALGMKGTLLGVDAVRDGCLVGRDLDQSQCLELASDGSVRIVVGVTGNQGFVFGRGNQQIGPDIIRRAWIDGITIVASAEKLARLPDPLLHLDTGDRALDAMLAGYVRVKTGPRRSMLMRLGA